MNYFKSGFWNLGVKIYIITLCTLFETFAQIDNSQKTKLIIEDKFSPPITYNKFVIEKMIEQNEECTIGVASGSVTTDGRPLVWKTRDNSTAPNNKVYYNTNYPIKFISVITYGSTYAWMGVNEHGFAILNSNSTDLDDGSTTGLGNGSFMRYALGTCATTTELEHLLDSTNITGRQTHANFGVIDSNRSAIIYETSGHQYWKYNANDTVQAPNGYVLRTNFAINGGGSGGIERYNRTVDLIAEFYLGDTLNYRSILRSQMRDFSDYESNPITIPYPNQWNPSIPFGYIYCYLSICRSISVSATVIQGILPDEPTELSTMWTLLGQPASSITVPYWPVGETPVVSNGSFTAPLCDIANQIKTQLFDYAADPNFIDTYKLRDEFGIGLWQKTSFSEDSIFNAAEMHLQNWRLSFPDITEILNLETYLANYTFQKLNKCYISIIASIPDNKKEFKLNHFKLSQNYPNPFNSTTNIKYELSKSEKIKIEVFNLLGQKVETLLNKPIPAGSHNIEFTTKDLPSGVYLYTIEAGDPSAGSGYKFQKVRKMVLLK